MNGWLALAVLALVPVVVHAAPTWSRRTDDPRWAGGRVTVATAPDAIWLRLQQVDTWPELFSDMRSIEIEERKPTHWAIELDTAIMECGPHDYDVTFNPDRTVHLKIDAPGIDAVVRLGVLDGPGADRAIVTFDMFAETAGVMGWFVPEQSVRERQQKMVVRYLQDLQRAFGESTGN